MAFSEEAWKIVKVFYEQGYTLGEIVKEPRNTVIKDRSLISRRAAKEGWVKGEKSTLVEKRIQQKQLHTEIQQENSTLNTTELDIINSIVDERTKHLALINNATHININRMMRKFDKKSKEYQEDMTIMENKLVQSTIKDARESLLGKETAPAVVNQTITIPQEELSERLNRLNELTRVIQG